MIKPRPREPLTKKAIEAISKYSIVQCGELPIHALMVRHVLEAERMRRADLYAWLEQRGYRWRGGYWMQSRATVHTVAPHRKKPA